MKNESFQDPGGTLVCPIHGSRDVQPSRDRGRRPRLTLPSYEMVDDVRRILANPGEQRGRQGVAEEQPRQIQARRLGNHTPNVQGFLRVVLALEDGDVDPREIRPEPRPQDDVRDVCVPRKAFEDAYEAKGQVQVVTRRPGPSRIHGQRGPVPHPRIKWDATEFEP